MGQLSSGCLIQVGCLIEVTTNTGLTVSEFIIFFFNFLVVKVSVYLNRRVFIMQKVQIYFPIFILVISTVKYVNI